MRPVGAGRVVLRAAVLAGSLSGLPSTAWTLARRGDLLASTRAAGTLLLPATAGPGRLLVAGGLAHGALSLGWSAALVCGLPRRRAVPAGALAGLGIAALDLRLARRLAPAVADLPTMPQVADHIAFGALVGWVRGRAASAPSRPGAWSG